MENSKEYYRILEARNGEKVPALVRVSDETQALHSLIDPGREAQKLLSTAAEDTGFFVFLGLGGGFAVEEALERTSAQMLVIDFNKDAITLLFSLKDYSQLLNNERVKFLIDPSPEEISNFISQNYLPALSGGINVFPLRARIEADFAKFDEAAKAIQAAVDSVSSDYSVQAHFGKRWFSNIIRNLKAAEMQTDALSALSPVEEAAIAAAGPSLDLQLTALKECKSKKVFIICADTALPVLLHHGIEPDAVVSIDCQHISYYHFMGCKIKNIPLFLDIASPPLFGGFSSLPVFFSSAHPLALYISQYWKPLPLLDTSGGNVTYSCLSLAEKLGAKRIRLFGADFSYVNSSSYARGTYIFPFFEKKQNRLSPMEALFSAFLYRSPFIQEPENSSLKKSYHETAQLRFYREKLEQKALSIYARTGAQVTPEPGLGAPINLPQIPEPKTSFANSSFAAENYLKSEKAKISSKDFLEQYCSEIETLPKAEDAEDYTRKLNDKETSVFTTLLPLIAAYRHRRADLKTSELINEAKEFCVKEIKKINE